MDISGLNDSQKQAVQTLEGPVLISAAAGSGKTRVLTYRIACLIAKGLARTDQILAVTFTNKAAKEMKTRLQILLKGIKRGEQGMEKGLWIGTFHSVCARILRENRKLIFPDSVDFTIYDTKDQMVLIKQIMKKLNIDDSRYSPKGLLSQIAYCKRKVLGAEDLTEHNWPGYGNRFQEIYREYEKQLIDARAFDFESLLLEAYRFLLKYPDHLKKYRERFRYISVDEYQDTNYIQYLLVKLLAQNHRNLCVVGDEDQSIYSWRGADISNILNFDRDFPECRIIKLEKNYRSTRTIIQAASGLIGHNRERQNKKLTTDNPLGEKIKIYACEDEYEEAKSVARFISESCKQGYSYEDFAVFYRTNAQSRVLEAALRGQGLAYQVVGSLKFYDRLEIKDVLAYLKFLSNARDELSLRRILNRPKRFVGAKTLELTARLAEQENISFYEALRQLSQGGGLKGKVALKVQEFISAMEDLRKLAGDESVPLCDLYTSVLEKTGYAEDLKNQNNPEALSRLENLWEFKNALLQFETEHGEEATLESFLKEMALLSPVEESGGAKGISLLTLHVSKGLEFNVVFMVGMEDGLCPLLRSAEDTTEEERRLVYVGMTRAKKKLCFSYAQKRHKFGKTQFNPPSPFLEEIPQKFLHFSGQGGKKGLVQKFSAALGSGTYKEPLPSTGTLNYGNYRVGQRVCHPHFGHGKILKLEGSQDNLRVSVNFGGRDIKKFMARAAHLDTEGY